MFIPVKGVKRINTIIFKKVVTILEDGQCDGEKTRGVTTANKGKEKPAFQRRLEGREGAATWVSGEVRRDGGSVLEASRSSGEPVRRGRLGEGRVHKRSGL